MMPAAHPIRRREDLWGSLLVILLIGWLVWTAGFALEPASSLVLPLVCGALGYVAARVLSTPAAKVVPVLVVLCALGLVLSGPDAILTASPRAGPFGYSSVTGAFFAAAAFAALTLAADARSSRWAKLAGWVLAGGFLAVCVITRTRAAVLLVPGFAGLAFILAPRLGARGTIAALAGVAFAGVGLTTALAARYAGPGSGTAVERAAVTALSERRLELQHDAWTLMVGNPVVGVGPGRFSDVSPAVALDSDAPWAHHEFLQYGAEAGIPAALLLVGLFSWAFWRVAISTGSRGARVLAAGALGTLALHSCVDFILQQPAVVGAVAALVGAAAGPYRQPDRRR